jgi:aminomethyltransferase
MLQRVFTNNVAKVEPGGAQYNMLLNRAGGIVDDLIVYRTAEHRYLVVPNAANTARVHAALLEHAGPGAAVSLRDDLALIAPQGPASFDVVGRLFPDATGLEYMHGMESSFGGQWMVVSRSGYTGERGFELFVPGELAAGLWQQVFDAGEGLGIEPCGLGARDTLRLEMGYPLHGNDISEARTPLEAGLSWAVAMGKGDFVGREALVRQKEEGIPSRLFGFRMVDRPIPRPHYRILAEGQPIGETTSGTFSPTLKIGVAMGYVTPPDAVAIGDRVRIDVRGRIGAAEVVKPPFVDSSPK